MGDKTTYYEIQEGKQQKIAYQKKSFNELVKEYIIKTDQKNNKIQRPIQRFNLII